jgi:OOP family OmpA-OmpF porin
VRSPRPRPVVAVEPPPPLLPDVLQEVTLPEAVTPPPPPPAQLEGARIVFRDPIAFEQGTTRIVPASQPVLDAVAEVILGPAADLHVVVEGHASDEGGFAYNYELSRERARAIVEALILRGVHPKRLSWRGAGEVEPVGAVARGEDEATREQNRRVVFRVMRPLDGEAPPTETEVRLPWSGEPHRVVPSPEPAPAEPAPAEPAAPEGVDGCDALPAAPDDEITLPSDLPEPTP